MTTIVLATTGHAAANAATNAAAGVGIGVAIIVWLVLGSALYFLPSIVAFSRKRPNAVPILVLNFFLGWSLIGWVVSLVWALSSDQPAQQIIVHNTVAPPGVVYTQPTAYDPAPGSELPPSSSALT